VIGDGYWTTGITLKPFDGKWAATAGFFDSGFCQDESTEGKLHTRYYCKDVEQAIDTLIADLQRLGIRLGAVPGQAPSLYMQGDGEDADVDYPGGWREMLVEQAKRLGWCTYDWAPERVAS
jgi:hypothetical protein